MSCSGDQWDIVPFESIGGGSGSNVQSNSTARHSFFHGDWTVKYASPPLNPTLSRTVRELLWVSNSKKQVEDEATPDKGQHPYMPRAAMRRDTM